MDLFTARICCAQLVERDKIVYCYSGAGAKKVLHGRRRGGGRAGREEERVTPLEFQKLHQTPCSFPPEGRNSQQSTEICCSAGSPGPAAADLTGGSRGTLPAFKQIYCRCYSSWRKR